MSSLRMFACQGDSVKHTHFKSISVYNDYFGEHYLSSIQRVSCFLLVIRSMVLLNSVHGKGVLIGSNCIVVTVN